MLCFLKPSCKGFGSPFASELSSLVLFPLCFFPLTIEGSPARAENYKLKLLHIAATLSLEHPGSLDTLSSQSVPSFPASSSPLSPLQRTLKETLLKFVGGRSEALRIGVDTVYGWTIGKEI